MTANCKLYYEHSQLTSTQHDGYPLRCFSTSSLCPLSSDTDKEGVTLHLFKLIAWNMRGTTWNVTRAKMAAHTQSALALLSFLHTTALFLANQWFLNVTVAYKGYPTLLIGSITLQLASRITWLRLVATYLIKYAEGTPWQLWMGLQRGRWHGTLLWVNNLFLCSQSGFWKLTSCIYCS